MSTEATIAKLKTNNIAQQALDLLEKFAYDKKLNVLPKFLEQAVSKDPGFHGEQKKSNSELLKELQALPLYKLDWQLLSEHHNLRTYSVANSPTKKPRSNYEALINAGIKQVNEHISFQLRNKLPIAVEINQFYVINYLRVELLHYLDRKEKFLSTNLDDHLKNTLIQLKLIQDNIQGFAKILAVDDPLQVVLKNIQQLILTDEKTINNLASEVLKAEAKKFEDKRATYAYPKTDYRLDAATYDSYLICAKGKSNFEICGQKAIQYSYFAAPLPKPEKPRHHSEADIKAVPVKTKKFGSF